MPIKNINLISPDDDPIVGALLEDGSICKVTATYNTTTAHIDTLLDNDGTKIIARKYGEIVCVDSNSKSWLFSTVIDHSLFHVQR